MEKQSGKKQTLYELNIKNNELRERYTLPAARRSTTRYEVRNHRVSYFELRASNFYFTCSVQREACSPFVALIFL
jgi:hypothetical protein